MCTDLMGGTKSHGCLILLSASVKLFDRTELIEQLLVDQPWHEEKLVVCHELINNLLLHAFGLQRADKKR